MAIYQGTDNVDNFSGSNADDTFYGEGGGDYITTGGGTDVAYGGLGNDQIQDTYGANQFGHRLTSGNDTLFGGEGNDSLTATDGTNSLLGEGGDDVLTQFAYSTDTWFLDADGGLGFDRLALQLRDFTVSTWQNVTFDTPKLVVRDIEEITVFLGMQDDRVTAPSDATFVLRVDGMAGHDTLRGGSVADYLIGGIGTDELHGGAGDDILAPGGRGYDTNDLRQFRLIPGFRLEGDVVYGGTGFDTLYVTGRQQDYILEYVSGGIRLVYASDGGHCLAYDIEQVRFSDAVVDARPPLFTSSNDHRVFSNIIPGSYREGEQYDAMDGDDVVWLPTYEDEYVAHGFVSGRAFRGGGGDDLLIGGSRGDVLDGGPGSDTVQGNEGSDTLTGGDGDDHLSGGDASDLIDGGAGGDRLAGGWGSDIFFYSDASESTTSHPDVLNDFASGEDAIDIMALTSLSGVRPLVQQSPEGSVLLVDSNGDGLIDLQLFLSGTLTGSDLLLNGGVVVIGDHHDQVVRGTPHSDALAGGGGNDQIAGAAGNDSLYGQDGNDVLFGQDGNDFAYGGAGSDAIIGGLGNDSLLGEDGDDSVFGQEGADLLYGGAGADGVYGGLENDTLLGGDGNDVLLGEEASDLLFGEAGVDLLIGAAGADTVFGGADGEQLIGGEGADTLNGEAGTDLLFGDAGADVLVGAEGNDTVYGGADGDALYGGEGADTLVGEDGADVIVGGAGADVLIGGAGGDLFLYQAVSDSTGAAADYIVGFVGGSDLVDLRPIDANTAVAGDQAFVFVTASGTLAAGQARLTYDAASGRTLFEADVDGVVGADLVILFEGQIGAAGNFLL